MISSFFSWLNLLWGQSLYFRGDFDKACNFLRRATRARENAAAGAFLYYGLALSRKGEWDQACEMVEKEKERYPQKEALLLFEGKILYDGGRLEEAEKVFEELCQKREKHWLAESYLEMIKLNQEEKVPADSKVMKEKFPPDRTFQTRLYSHLIQRRCPPPDSSHKEALKKWRKKYKEELKAPSGKGEGAVARCDDYLIRRKDEKALEEAQKAVEADPQSEEAHLYLAYSLWKNHRFEEVRDQIFTRQKLWFYRHLREFENLLALSLLASASAWRGKLYSACRYLALLEALDEDEWESRLARAEVLIALREEQKGWALLEKLFREDPDEFSHRLEKRRKLLVTKEDSPRQDSRDSESDSTSES